jgi:hypothetical protein
VAISFRKTLGAALYHTDAKLYTGFKKRKKWLTGGPTGWVSFDRPYGQFCQDHLVDRPNSVGSGEFLLWEFPLTYWMEQQGYDVSYQSGVDTHKDGPGLQRAKASFPWGMTSIGHGRCTIAPSRRVTRVSILRS